MERPPLEHAPLRDGDVAARHDDVGTEDVGRAGDHEQVAGQDDDRADGMDDVPVWIPNLQPDFNVRVRDSFDAISSAVLRELDESNRFVQKSAEST